MRSTMAGPAYYVAVKPRRRKSPTLSLGEIAQRIARVVHSRLSEIRRARPMILAALREESDEWTEGPEGSIVLGFSGACDPVVVHAAGMALLRGREWLESSLAQEGYELDHEHRWSLRWVPAACAAVWGTTREPGTRSLGGPLVKHDNPFGWREVSLDEPSLDEGSRYSARTGLCACEQCVWSRRCTMLVPRGERRSGRDTALDRAEAALDALDPSRRSAVLADLEAWTWNDEPPASLLELERELGRSAPTLLELAALLGRRAKQIRT